MHKAKTLSRLKDNAPMNKRTTFCGALADNKSVIGSWKSVTCAACKNRKMFKGHKRKKNEVLALRSNSVSK